MRIIFTVIAIVILASPANSSVIGKPIYPYPTVQELYNNCREYIVSSEADMKGFLKSYCAARLTGFMEGQVLFSSIALKSDVFAKPGDQESVRSSVTRAFNSKICFNINSYKVGPIELIVAKEFLNYIDGRKAEKHDVPIDKYLASPSQLAVMDFFNDHYSCK